MENISYWFIENGKPKNIYGFWVKHTNNGPLSQASLKHHWKCCDCRRRQFNESLSNICGSFKNSWEKKNSINSKERNVKVILRLNCVVYVKVLKVRWKTWHHNMTIWKTLWFFTTAYRTTFFRRNDHCWDHWWKARKSNEPVLESCKQMVNDTFCSKLNT